MTSVYISARFDFAYDPVCIILDLFFYASQPMSQGNIQIIMYSIYNHSIVFQVSSYFSCWHMIRSNACGKNLHKNIEFLIALCLNTLFIYARLT